MRPWHFDVRAEPRKSKTEKFLRLRSTLSLGNLRPIVINPALAQFVEDMLPLGILLLSQESGAVIVPDFL